MTKITHRIILTKLSQFEQHLQSLVEGSLSKLFSTQDMTSEEFVTHLQKIMHEGCKKLADGRIIAPNLFIIKINPETAIKQPVSEEILVNLSTHLEQYASRSHWTLLDHPLVMVEHDETIQCGNYDIQSRIHLEQIAQTTTLDSESFSEPLFIPENAFLIVNGVEIFLLNLPVINIGRRPDNQLVIDDPRVSRSHAQLRAIKGNYIVFDLDSTGGTYVNNQLIHQSVLFPGDVISLAGLPIIFGQDEGMRGGTERVQSTGDKPLTEEVL